MYNHSHFMKMMALANASEVGDGLRSITSESLLGCGFYEY